MSTQVCTGRLTTQLVDGRRINTDQLLDEIDTFPYIMAGNRVDNESLSCLFNNMCCISVGKVFVVGDPGEFSEYLLLQMSDLSF